MPPSGLCEHCTHVVHVYICQKKSIHIKFFEKKKEGRKENERKNKEKKKGR